MRQNESSEVGIKTERWLRVRIVFTIRSKDWDEETKEDVQADLEAIGGDIAFKTEGTVYSKEFPIRERFV